MQRVNLIGRSWSNNWFVSLWESQWKNLKKMRYRSSEWPTDLPGRWSGQDAARTNEPPESRSWPRRTPAMGAARMPALPMQDAHTSSSSRKSARPRSPSFSPSLQESLFLCQMWNPLLFFLNLLAPWLASNPPTNWWPTQPTLGRKIWWKCEDQHRKSNGNRWPNTTSSDTSEKSQ